MYLSFLLLIAIIYNRVTLFLFRVKQPLIKVGIRQRCNLYIQRLAASLRNSLFHIAVSDFSFIHQLL